MEAQNSKYLIDSIVGIVIVSVSLLFYFYLIPNYVTEGSSFGISPRFFPTVGILIVGSMGALLTITSVIKLDIQQLLKSKSGRSFTLNWKGPALIIVILSILCITFEKFGYYGSVSGSLFLLMLAFGQRHIPTLILISIFLPAALFLLFSYGLNLPLE